MKRLYQGAAAFFVCLAVPAFSADQPKYLDLTIVKVKPDKHAEFQTVSKKIADLNRRYKGDHWIAFDTVYGPESTVEFAVPRMNYAGVDQGLKSFMGALQEGMGGNSASLENEFGACVESMRNELRAWRWDLSRNVPQDPAEFDRMIGGMRWVRTVEVTVRMGHNAGFEAVVGKAMDALYNGNPNRVVLVTQSMVGQDTNHYYLTLVAKDLADFDGLPNMREGLGEELYHKFLDMNKEDVTHAVYRISRVLPELSNPPEAIVNVSRDYWMPPQPMMAARKARDKKAK
jgi:hypothetical protein